MDRRSFLVGVGALVATPTVAQSQQAGKVYVIAWMSPYPFSSGAAEAMAVVRAGLRERGWTDGKDFTIVRRDAGGDETRLDALAADVLKLNPDVIVTFGLAALAARRATATIPIVVASITDPVNHGLVSSLARPGGNITGMSMGEFRRGKLMQLLKEAVPQIKRVALLNDTHGLGLPSRVTEVPPTLGIEVVDFNIESRQDLERAFASIARGRFDAVYGSGATVTSANVRFIAEQALKLRLPCFVLHASTAEVEGLLFSYRWDVSWQTQRIAYYVDRILRGTKPGDIPIEQSDKFELTINLKAAKALGLTIPPSLLLRADKVIE